MQSVPQVALAEEWLMRDSIRSGGEKVCDASLSSLLTSINQLMRVKQCKRKTDERRNHPLNCQSR